MSHSYTEPAFKGKKMYPKQNTQKSTQLTNRPMANIESNSPPSTPMFEVAARTCLLRPKPRPLPITVNTTWFEDNVNEHSLFKTRRKGAKDVQKTLEASYARPASRGSTTRQALFGLPETAELVEQFHEFQTQEHDDPPPYYEAVELILSPTELSARARTFSDVMKHGNKLEENGILKFASELDEASDTQRTFSTFLRRSGVASRQSAAGILGLPGYAYMPHKNGINLHSKETAAATTRGTDDPQTEAGLHERVAVDADVDADVEAQTKARSHNR
ncbi:uncharacterized protein CC84DRAFT_818697 [Paraphaeosphaeria sporulosa]|uniref:Uncharacterized protein n=1 Tax=Paraphaeosphaeria sporulosa TaxID=1460663 RepID=A0A177CE01_9PLEO|nr:uncharacterized protein CC84DRAFT_818697 [Paraphaeosphaeria sporulosa]OAG05029.1 hypothetical protein CC84DRAFT_818697 [Paraphaeosphaeria sporulosa]